MNKSGEIGTFWRNYAFDKFSSLSSLKGGEGRGEEAKTDSNSTPLTPTLFPFGRGEGVEAAARLNACQIHSPAFWQKAGWGGF